MPSSFAICFSSSTTTVTSHIYNHTDFYICFYRNCIQFSFFSLLPVPLKAPLLSTPKMTFINLSQYETECFTPTKKKKQKTMSIYEAYVICIPISCCSNYSASLLPFPPPNSLSQTSNATNAENTGQVYHRHFNTSVACHRAR